jgi:glycerol-3-phosphate O-acyltransferase/dihydroxyacetone phosphate acyltransferase
MIYGLSKGLARLANFIFFTKIEFEGKLEQPEGALIFTSNHPNMLLDVLVTGPYLPRKVHYIAKSSLFKNPFLKFFLLRVGVIPVYRKDHGEGGDNQSSFQKAIEILEAKKAIAIFPEGTSHAEERLLPFKTGTARMAFEAEAKNDFKLKIRLVPLGIHFYQRDAFRSKVLVRIGEPLPLESYEEIYRKDEREAVRQVTDDLYQRIQRLTLNLIDQNEGKILKELSRVYLHLVHPHQLKKLKDSLEIRDEILEAYRWYKEKDPEKTQAFYLKVSSFLNLVDRFGYEDDHLKRPYSLSKVFSYSFLRGGFLLIGAPLHAISLIFHYLPYRIPGWMASRIEDVVEKGTAKLVWGLILFPLFYLLYGVLASASIGWSITWKCLLGLPFLGIFSLFYLDRLFPFYSNMKTFFKLNLRKQEKHHLRELSKSLQEEWKSLQAHYFEEKNKKQVQGRKKSKKTKRSTKA